MQECRTLTTRGRREAALGGVRYNYGNHKQRRGGVGCTAPQPRRRSARTMTTDSTTKHRRKRPGKYDRIGAECLVCSFNFSVVVVQHHIKPLGEGGSNRRENLVWLCPNCHGIIHWLKNALGRQFITNKQLVRSQMYSSRFKAIDETLHRMYSDKQVETLWIIAEETYKNNER